MDRADLTNDDTLAKLLLSNLRRYGANQVAAREKTLGIWRSYSWQDYYDIVRYLSLAFLSFGLKRGDRVSILAENKPHAFWFELAVHCGGGVVVGIFADCTPPEVEYYLKHSGSRFVVCQNQEQVDKCLEIKHNLPELEKIIYWDPKGLWNYNDPLLTNMDRMLELGKEVESRHPALFGESIAAGKGDDLAVFLYSSGTTGNPKAAMVSHKALIGMAEAINDVDRYEENEEYLSFLPLAWIGEQLLGVACSLRFRLRANFPEEPETVQENIREIGPGVVFFGPRLWESLIRMIQVRIQDSGWINRVCYKTALAIGYAMAEFRMTGRIPGTALALANAAAERLVFGPLRDNIGLRKTRVAYSAGGAISPEVIRYFHAIGVNLKQLYGSSEVGVCTLHRDGDIKPESCGPPLPGVEARISDHGEVELRTRAMFSGYFGEEAKTAEKVVDGWYKTGDLGHIDKDGHIIVMDRMEDVMELQGGKKFSPQFCEVRLRFSPYIKDALVVAREGEAFAGVLVNIDLGNVGQWAESRRIPYTTFTDLSQKPEIIDLIRGEISKVNEVLPDYSRIRKFINLHKEFDPDEAEMTRTRKLRRTFIEERFKHMIDGIFSTQREIEVTSQVTYRDGRSGVTKTVLKIESC